MSIWDGTLEQQKNAVLGRTHLSDGQVSEIEERWIQGETLLSLSAVFDCVPETIKRQLRKRGWQRPLNVFDRTICAVSEYQRGYDEGFKAGKKAR